MRIGRLQPAMGLIGMPPVDAVRAAPQSRVGASAGRARVQNALSQATTSAFSPLAAPKGQVGATSGAGERSGLQQAAGFSTEGKDAFGLNADSFERGGVTPGAALNLLTRTQSGTQNALARSNVSLVNHRMSMGVINNIGR